MKVRIEVSPTQYNKLWEATRESVPGVKEPGELSIRRMRADLVDHAPFVKILSVGGKGSECGNILTLDLDIEESVLMPNSDWAERVCVSREMLNRVFSLLGIFPDEAGVKGREAKITKQLEEITRLAGKMIERAEGDRDRSLVTNLPHSTVQDAERIIELCSKI